MFLHKVAYLMAKALKSSLLAGCILQDFMADVGAAFPAFPLHSLAPLTAQFEETPPGCGRMWKCGNVRRIIAINQASPHMVMARHKPHNCTPHLIRSLEKNKKSGLRGSTSRRECRRAEQGNWIANGLGLGPGLGLGHL